MTDKPAPHRNPAPPRASRDAPKEPSTLAEHEEAVRERLSAHGQHGALAAFGKYTAAVNARLELKGALAGDELVDAKPLIEALENQSKPKAKPAKAKKAK